MSKRSAFTVAGGLVAAILAVVVALSTLGLARTSTPATVAQAQKPIVKTITKTITIHRKASAKPATAQRGWSEDAHQGGKFEDSHGRDSVQGGGDDD